MIALPSTEDLARLAKAIPEGRHVCELNRAMNGECMVCGSVDHGMADAQREADQKHATPTAPASGRVKVPDGQTPLNEKLSHPLLDVFNEGIAARDNGTSSPYHGHSLEHCLHAAGWVQRDLRLALDATKAATQTAQEAVPTEDELDEAWKSGFNAGFGEAMIAAHPPQPSETVAEAQIDAIAVTLSKRIYKQTEGEWQPNIRQADELARDAMRALKGEDE